MFDRVVCHFSTYLLRVVPIRFEGHELVVATSKEHLARALRFATMVIGRPVYLVVAEPQQLGEWLCDRYPIPGMTPQSVDRDSFNALLAMCRNGSAMIDEEARRQSLLAS